MTQINDKYQSGFSLLEVLIALLILSIGLLGIAGLQVTSKRINQEAIQRTTATMLARDMIERMRANASQFTAIYTNAGAGWEFTPSAGITTADTDCFNVTCDAATLASYDLYEWENAILGITEVSGGGANTGGLVTPTACITVPGGSPAGTVVIAIAWRGMVAIPDQPAPGKNACGDGTGLYDDATTGEANVFRRVIELQTFINTT